MTIKTAARESVFIIFAAAVCHYLFSPYGFNPTDEGFVLSASNRVLHGQIPHVDFSSVRPLGYAYLHIPELLICKEYTYLLSRFVFWLEQVLIAYLWIRFVKQQTSIRISGINTYLLVILTLLFNVHYFPISVLHTIDGLLMCLIGWNLLSSGKKYTFFGFVFIGFAALCKQNYLVLLPVSLLLFHRKNIVLNLIAGLSPLLLYIAYVSLYQGWDDLVTQLSGHRELAAVGIKRYLFGYLFYAGILAAVLAKKLKIPAAVYLLCLLAFATGLLLTNHYHGNWSLVLFGALLVELFSAEKESGFRNTLFVGAALAWCVSISVGYNTPALFLGGCLSLLILLHRHPLHLQTGHLVNTAIVLLLATAFYVVRTTTIYRDAKAAECIYPLDSLVEGARGILTNERTYKVLAELDSLKRANPNLVVAPDFTACNILHSHESKILTEWPNKTEIPNDGILKKVTSAINGDSTLLFAIPKYQTALLKDGFVEYPAGGAEYPIVRYIKVHYPKVSPARYFELYRKN